MIVREQGDRFVMIGQDEHARLSGVLAERWRDDWFQSAGSGRRRSVELAVAEHDRGWMAADSFPIWNDRAEAPYSFVDFPPDLKYVLYRRGLDEVEAMDPYAAMICSHHYTRFADRSEMPAAQAFARAEQARRARLKEGFPPFDSGTFQFHVDFLRFCDELSLFVCLNEPGASKETEHPWYRDGIPVPATFAFVRTGRVGARWRDADTVLLHKSPFDQPVTVSFKQKVIKNRQAVEEGLGAAYENAEWTTCTVTVAKEANADG